MYKKLSKAILIRAIKTMCQTFVALVGTKTFIEEVPWIAVLSATALAGLVSVANNLAVGLPEIKLQKLFDELSKELLKYKGAENETINND